MKNAVCARNPHWVRPSEALVVRFCVAILLTLNAAVAHSQQPESTSVDSYIRGRMQDLHIPGLSIAVIKEGSIVQAKGYGLANLETNTPATPETVFKTASLSKPIIATAVMLLVQEGKIGLDDKVSKYLDGTPDSWREITIRHLLTHTSGIVRDPSDYHPYSEQAVTDSIKAVYPVPLSFQPGEKWLYSNVGYHALAEIITKVSGRPWDEFIAEKLFVPARMTSTRTTTVTEIVPHRASGYQWKNDRMIHAEDWIAVRPSGAFLSTVLDLAKWDAFLDANSILSAASRKLMWTPVTLNDKKSADYGFGWFVDSFLGHSRIHHDGQFPGFRSDYEHFEDDKLTVIVLANCDQARLESLAVKIAGFYAPALATPPFTLRAEVVSQGVASGNPLAIRVTATDDGKAAPDSVVEMEIWDDSGAAVYKQHQRNETFNAGQTKTYEFMWTPAKAGRYTVNVGAYGPKWVPSYAWKQYAATITVH